MNINATSNTFNNSAKDSPPPSLNKRITKSIKHADNLEKPSNLREASPNFIDVTQPMFQQVWNSNWSKKFYMEQIHIPRHVNGSAPIFGKWMEFFTKTPWYIVPLIWIPFSIWIFNFSLQDRYSLPAATTYFFFGVLFWTILEYGIHRFLFHVDDVFPDDSRALAIHFLLHGVHHFLPMDR